MKNELVPIDPPFTPEVAEILQRYPQGKDGYIIKLFRVFANSLRFLTTKGALNLLDSESPLSIHEREIVILRVTANKDCEYEWGVHVSTFARAANLSDDQVAATRIGGSKADCWTSEERLLLDCIDQLCDNAMIDNATYEAFQQQWTVEQQLEIMALCGNYHLISFVANTSRISSERIGARFPR